MICWLDIKNTPENEYLNNSCVLFVTFDKGCEALYWYIGYYSNPSYNGGLR